MCGELSQQAASDRYNIPRRTLRNHLITRSTIKQIGRAALLNQDLEKDLAALIMRFANNGIPLTPKIVRRQAFVFCERNNIKHNFNKELGIAGRHWFRLFIKRNPEVGARMSQII